MIELARIYRGTNIESIHHGYLAIAKHDQAKVIDHDFATFTRSILKPLQAKVSKDLSSGLLKDKYLAIACASHNNEKGQLDVLNDFAKNFDLDINLLQCGICGVHHKDAKPINHNCAGKHLAFLLACQQQSWSVHDYHLLEHPLQQAIVTEIKRLMPQIQIDTAIDGCGVPTFYMQLKDMALMFRTMIQDSSYQEIIATMNRYPMLIAGKKYFDSLLMAQYPSKYLAKGGAEGLMLFADLDLAQVVVLKTLDGSQRVKAACSQALIGIELEGIGLDLTNSKGEKIGFIKSSVDKSLLDL